MRKRKMARLLLSILLTAAVLGSLAYIVAWRLDQARAEFDTPIVMITRPVSGTAAYADTYLSVAATAMGRSAIKRVELWLDDDIALTQEAGQPEGVTPFSTSFHLLIPEGEHILFVRAVNSVGMTGQSLPLSFVSRPKPGPGEAVLVVQAPADTTLEDIAKSNGTDLATMQKLNPQLKGGEPISGTTILIPMPPAKNASPSSAPGAGSSEAPVNPSGGASVKKSLPVPSSPPLKMSQVGLLQFNAGTFLALTKLHPPAAATGLSAEVTACKVKLVWQDNADDESNYLVWMATPVLPPQMIASLDLAAGGVVWFEFPAPATGNLSFWVEAANSVGGRPSNIASVNVDSTCPSSLPTQLQVELLGMSVSGKSDQVYCYASLQDAPETRLPQDPSEFVPVQGGQANVDWTLVLSLPENGVLNLTGECWGWTGKTLSKLGSFAGSYPTDTWDGSKRVLPGGSFEIGVSIKPLAGSNPNGPVVLLDGPLDPTLPPPYDVEETGYRCPFGPDCQGGTYLNWKWDPNPKSPKPINGFQILLNGEPYKTVNDPNASETEVTPPNDCGLYVEWQVVAVRDGKWSMRSLPYEYETPDCKEYIQVQFDRANFPFVDDGNEGDTHKCDTIDVYFGLEVSDRYSDGEKDYFGKGTYKIITCGLYTFKYLTTPYKDPYADTIVIPIIGYPTDVQIQTWFIDSGIVGPDKRFGINLASYHFDSLKDAQNQLACYRWTHTDQLGWTGGMDVSYTRLYYTINVFPPPSPGCPAQQPAYDPATVGPPVPECHGDQCKIGITPP